MRKNTENDYSENKRSRRQKQKSDICPDRFTERKNSIQQRKTWI